MNLGAVGFFSSVAGTQLAQAGGADAERSQQEGAVQARGIDAGEKAEKAAGIGRTESEHETADRDADGRRPWEIGPRASEGDAKPGDTPSGSADPPRSKDPTGERGQTLDLSA